MNPVCFAFASPYSSSFDCEAWCCSSLPQSISHILDSAYHSMSMLVAVKAAAASLCKSHCIMPSRTVKQALMLLHVTSNYLYAMQHGQVEGGRATGSISEGSEGLQRLHSLVRFLC